MAVMYICDRKKYCNASELCGKQCKHTADRNHCLYREHEHFIKKGQNSWEQEQEDDNGEAVE